MRVIAGCLSVGLIGAAMTASFASERSSCTVFELRQYTLKPGQREVLVDLFDRNFVEPQEALGATVVGQFRDLRRADRFVWVRGFADMQSRHEALERFYGGPVWAAHRTAANATMLDSDDVLLLKPARPDTAFRLDTSERPAQDEKRAATVVLAGIHHLRQAADPATVSLFETQVAPALRADGVRIDALFVTEPAPNTFKRLPVREGEQVLVWFGSSAGPRAPKTAAAGWLEGLSGSLGTLADQPPILLELEPTPRSLWGHPRAGR